MGFDMVAFSGGKAMRGPNDTGLLLGRRALIEAALAECRGRVSGPAGAAAKLGLPRQTLESKIKALGIDTQRFKSR